MSNKLRLKLIIVLAICMFACAFAGCSIGFMTYDEFLDEYAIAAQVTYYGNGGYFSENTAILSVEISYTTGSKIYTPKEGTASHQVKRSNYDLVGWYNVAQRTYVETNDDGEDEEVLYFVLDVTDEDLAADSALTKDGSGYYFEYTSELTTTTDATSDEDEDDSSSADSSDDDSTSSDSGYELDDDAEVDTSYLTQRMYYIKDTDGKWIMSQEDYDYYVRLRKEYNTDTSISVPNLEYGEAMDSSITLEDGQHLYMVADWVKSVSINYVLVMLDGEVDKDGKEVTSVSVTSSGTTYTVNENETLFTEYFGTQSAISRTDSSGVDVTLNDATVLAFYYDAECTQRVNGAAISKPEEDEDGNSEDVTLYALCIYGTYTIVRNPDGVKDMFSSGSDNYYIFGNDEYAESKTIDCTGVTVSPFTTFSDTIKGNGYTITNLTVSKSSVSGTPAALFGQVADGAVISDLTFDGMQIEYQTSTTQAVNIYLVAIAAQGVKNFDISGLTIKNANMYITLAARSADTYTYIRNIQYLDDNTYEQDNWLYGDMTDYANNSFGLYYTDADFISAYGGANVESCTVYVREGLSGTYVAAVSSD